MKTRSRIVYRPLDTADRDYGLIGFLVRQAERRRAGLMQALEIIASELRE